MLRRILCPVDLSAASRRAFRQALALAQRHGAVVTVLQVFPAPVLAGAAPSRLPRTPAPGMDLEEQHREDLRGFVRPDWHGGVPLELRIEYGDVPEEIATQASATRADLVVLDDHRRAEGILRKAGVPVLVVSRRSAPAPAASGFRRIVCGIDFSPVSAHAAEWAVSLADASPPGSLVLVHVLEGFPHQEVAAGQAGLDLGLYWRYREGHAREGLAELAAAHAGPRPMEAVVASGNPWLEILDVAEAREADLIVVGGHRGGASGEDGGTAERLVHEAACPVLIVPPR